MTEEEKDENELFLEDTKAEDLTEDTEDGELDFTPPEENKAKQLNVGNIFMVIGIAAIIIVGVIVLVSKISRSKKEETAELDKAGTKFMPNIELKDKEIPFDFVNDENDDFAEKKRQEVDEIIKTLPEDFQQPEPGIAPVSVSGGSSGGSGAYKSDRPDTRNSVSIRKIEGIAGQENYSYESKSNIISNALSGSSSYPYGGTTSQSSGQRMSKEDYIASLMKQANQVSQASYRSYGTQQNQTQQQMNQQNKESFYNSSANTAGNGQYLSYSSLWDGTIITGALVTAINTDNPGVVIARVTENVYSSYDSSFLLIPEGTLLYATYNSSVNYGQNRVQIAWNLMIRPDGYRIELGNMNGVDSKGQSGTKGFATNHPFETLKALGLVAMFSIIQTEITQNIKTQNNPYIQNSMNDVYAEASKLGNKIVDRALDIKPTIRIKQGTQIKFITNMPLELPPVKVNQVNRKYVRN